MPGGFSIADCHGLKLAWAGGLEGGGQSFGQDFVPVVGHLFGSVGRLYEFCAGPGYIGFSLLALGHCDELVVSDVNPRAVDALRETVRINGLEARVTVYESDGLEGIPAHERWDLVVSNPPHFAEQALKEPSLRHDDLGWRLHRDFYLRVGDFLAPGGSLLIQENSQGSTPEDFLPMIADGGLSHVQTLWYSSGWTTAAFFYFLWIKKALPGLVVDGEPAVAVIPLREAAGAPLQVSQDMPCVLRLVNETDHPVRPQLRHESGAPAWWVPIGELAPGQERQLPLMSLRAGEFELHDETRGVTLALLVVG